MLSLIVNAKEKIEVYSSNWFNPQLISRICRKCFIQKKKQPNFMCLLGGKTLHSVFILLPQSNVKLYYSKIKCINKKNLEGRLSLFLSLSLSLSRSLSFSLSLSLSHMHFIYCNYTNQTENQKCKNLGERKRRGKERVEMVKVVRLIYKTNHNC